MARLQPFNNGKPFFCTMGAWFIHMITWRTINAQSINQTSNSQHLEGKVKLNFSGFNCTQSLPVWIINSYMCVSLHQLCMLVGTGFIYQSKLAANIGLFQLLMLVIVDHDYWLISAVNIRLHQLLKLVCIDQIITYIAHKHQPILTVNIGHDYWFILATSNKENPSILTKFWPISTLHIGLHWLSILV